MKEELIEGLQSIKADIEKATWTQEKTRTLEALDKCIEALQPPPGFEEWVEAKKWLHETVKYDETCGSIEYEDDEDVVYVSDLRQYFATLSTYDADKEVAVPIEPTDEMIDMGCETGAGHYRADVLLIYTAMLKASKPEDA